MSGIVGFSQKIEMSTKAESANLRRLYQQELQALKRTRHTDKFGCEHTVVVSLCRKRITRGLESFLSNLWNRSVFKTKKMTKNILFSRSCLRRTIRTERSINPSFLYSFNFVLFQFLRLRRIAVGITSNHISSIQRRQIHTSFLIEKRKIYEVRFVTEEKM